MIDPITLGLVSAGVQGISAIGSFFGGQSAAAAENEARIEQYKQQMLIRDVRDQQRFGQYGTKVVGMHQNLAGLDKQFAYQQAQEGLKMNELLKGSKLASQNKLVNEIQSAGKVTASMGSGVGSAKGRQSAIAKLGREASVRQEQMTTSVYAKQMREDAMRLSLDAAKMKEYNQVRFAPSISPVQEMGALVDGPSPLSLVADLGQAALGGMNAYQGQANFNAKLAISNPVA